MHEVHEASGLHALEQLPVQVLYAVPAHMGDFRVGGGGEAAYVRVEDPEAGRAAFLGTLAHYLHAHADAQDGLPALHYDLVEPFGAQARDGFRRIAHTGKDDLRCRCHDFKWYLVSTSFYSCCIDEVAVESSVVGCQAPVIVSNSNDYNSFTATWSGASDNYEVSYMAATDADYSTPVAVNAHTYTLTGLTPATQYNFRLRALCDSGDVSAWTNVNFTTDSLPCFAPEALQQTAVGYTSVTLDWIAGGDEQNWVVKVFNSRIGELLDTVSAHPATIEGLSSNETYYAAVMAACGSNLDGFSDWSDTISFTTAQCLPVSNLQASSIAGTTSVMLSWTASDADSWQIEYGYQGFGQGEGTTLSVNTNPYTVTGLEELMIYDFYVRSACEADVVSTWSNVATATTDMPGVTCGTVTGVHADVDVRTVTLGWDAVENATGYEIEYGAQGFVHGNGTVVEVANVTTHELSNMNDGNYTVYVRALCGSMNYGPWSEATNFTVDPTGIPQLDNGTDQQINIYPNPSNGSTTISVSGINGKVTIEIVDMNGRTINSTTQQINNSTDVNVNGLTQGAYFVRIYGEEINSIRKLIVR